MATSTVDAPNFAAYTPAETAELICRAGVKKGNTRPDKVFLSAIFGGCILSFGCAVSLTAVTAPWYQENAPGLVKLAGAIVFPIGLVTIFLTGAELFTSTNMVSGLFQISKQLLTILLVYYGSGSQWEIVHLEDATALVSVFLRKPAGFPLRHGPHCWVYVSPIEAMTISWH